jgi:hypothetical protein
MCGGMAMSCEKRSVECIASIDSKGNVKPMRIRFEDDQGVHVIDINKVLEQEIKRTFSTMNRSEGRAFHYKCESVIEGMLVPYKLLFDNNSCKWFLL